MTEIFKHVFITHLSLPRKLHSQMLLIFTKKDGLMHPINILPAFVVIGIGSCIF